MLTLLQLMYMTDFSKNNKMNLQYMYTRFEVTAGQ